MSAIIGLTLAITANGQKIVELPSPNLEQGMTVMSALKSRCSIREFDTKALSLQQLGDLLWAANGVNRDNGNRTAPSGMNRQEIDVYAFLQEGVFLYNAQEHVLEQKAEGDYRDLVAGPQEFVLSAPVSLVMVANLDKLMDVAGERSTLMAAVDAGNVSENINLYCASVGLATVPRATMNIARIRAVLSLGEHAMPIMNNPVGYAKK